MLRLGALALRDLHRADVARHAQHVGGPQDPERIAILDQLARDPDRALARIEQDVLVDVAVVEGGGGEEDLHRRARFDDVGEGAGARVGVVELAEAVRIEARRFGEGEDVAGPRIEGEDETFQAVLIGEKTQMPLTLALPGLTREERRILLNGCLMNDYAAKRL